VGNSNRRHPRCHCDRFCRPNVVRIYIKSTTSTTTSTRLFLVVDDDDHDVDDDDATSSSSSSSSFPSSSLPNFPGEDLVAAACQPLLWETLERASRRPVLDLSARRIVGPTTTLISAEDEVDDAAGSTPCGSGVGDDGDGGGGDPATTTAAARTNKTTEWDRGQRWAVTKEALSAMGVMETREGTAAVGAEVMDDESYFLGECPQLLRLESSVVKEMAEWVVERFGIQYVRSCPALLGYRAGDDAEYGIQFMNLMMMTEDCKPALRAAAAGASSSGGKLLLEAIRGGIQERAVKAALGSAATAASRASQSIAADAVASYRQLRANSPRKKGL
jgi:hypothetical protein